MNIETEMIGNEIGYLRPVRVSLARQIGEAIVFIIAIVAITALLVLLA